MSQTNVFERKSKSQRRVVVTGLGIVSPIGLNLEENWQALLEGRSGIGPITQFDTTGQDVRIAGEVKNFDPSLYVPKKEQKKMDRFIQLSLACAKMGLEDAGLDLKSSESLSQRSGAIMGIGIGGLPGIEYWTHFVKERGPSRASPFYIPSIIANMAPGYISIDYGIKGPNYSVASACASSAHAIGEAARYIRDGICDVMVTGGAESVITPTAIAGFAAMKALSTRNDQPELASRPFDRDRDGFVMGEGAAILILEDYEHASRRGAKIYAELLGYGVSSDAYHMTNPAPGGEGAARAMQMALRDAGIAPEEIQYVNAHGTSTPAGDGVETEAIKTVFGSHAKKLWVSSTKSMTGHTLGAAGAIESVYSVLALQHQVAPPTINLDHPSDDCDLDYVPNTPREGAMKAALSNSFGFGGTNASLIFSKI